MARAAVPTTWLFCALAFLFAMIADTADLQTLTSGGYPQVLLRAPQIGPWILGAVLTVIVGVYRIGGAVSRSAGELVITLLVATGLMVACCWMSLRCGYLVTPTEVVSREGALWKPDVRLPLDRLVRVETGCTVHHGRSASYSPVMVVVFRSGVRRSEDTVKLLELAQANGARLIPDADIAAVDLGDWVDGRHLAKWTEGMARVAQLPQFRNAQWMPDTDAATGRCIDKLVGPLDADHRAQLLDLLGYR